MSVLTKYSWAELQNGGKATELIRLIDNGRAGSIICIAGYESKSNVGEVANFFVCKGVNYAKTVEKSLTELDALMADPTMQLNVKWKEWVKRGTEVVTTAACKDKELKQRQVTLYAGDQELRAGFDKVRQSLTNPQEASVEYDKQGNGVYSYGDTLYIRDCRLLNKVVVREGENKVRTQKRQTAIADAIRNLLSVSKYREFLLDGRYRYIAVGGEQISPEAMIIEAERELTAETGQSEPVNV